MGYAYANGINYFDTAYNYHNGESEVDGDPEGFSRESFCLATKMPTWLVTDLERGKELLNSCKSARRIILIFTAHALSSIKITTGH